MNKSTLIFWIVAGLLSGCQTTHQQRHSFPSVWPEGVQPSSKTAALTAQTQVPASVWIGSIDMDPESSAVGSSTGSGRTTSAALRDLLSEKLRQAGIPVTDQPSRYTLIGVVPRMGYTARGGYPRKLIYTTELVYRLVDRNTGDILIDRSLQQEVEQTVLVNTMTKLPQDPNAPEQELLRQCMEPTFNLVASSVKESLEAAK